VRLDGFKVHGAAVVAVLCTGVGYALAAGGGTEVTLAGPQVLRLIQQAPAALSSYPSLTMTMTMSVSANGRTVNVREDALMSHDGRTGSFVVHPAGAGHDIDLFFVGQTIYAPAPAGHYPAITGKQWLAYAGSLPTATSVPNGKDALAFLRMMPGATGPVRVMGHDTVDHARTTHYRVTIDVLKAVAAEPAELRNADTMAELQRVGVTTMPIDIWLDDQHAPRQITFALSVDGVSMHAQMRFRGSSTPLTVTAPDPAVTYDVTDLQQFLELAAGR
jgi:hypothetical protein